MFQSGIEKPVVSIVMPVYNNEVEVGDAINSILLQSIKGFELIVVNDGSSDRSADVVRRYTDPRIKLIEQENLGVAAARNRGIRESRSDLVAFLDADDVWMTDYLETIFFLVKKYPHCAVFSTAYILHDGSNTAVPKIPFSYEDGMLDDYFMLASRGSPPVWTGAVVVRKDALKSVGCFTPGIKAGEDLLCWAKLAQKYKVAFFNEPKAIYNFPVELGVGRNVRMPDSVDRVYPELVDIYKRETNFSRKKSIRRYIGHWCKMRLHIYAYKGSFPQAYKEYRKLLRFNPLNLKALALFLLAAFPSSLRDLVFNVKSGGMR